MFFALPMLTVIGVYVLAAILPALFLMGYIYKKDKVDKEPPGLLLSLVFMGVAAALVSIVLEYLGENNLNAFISPSNPHYTIVLAFLVVAAVEEGTKFFFLYKRTWHDYNFNYRFDGVVYAVFVSLGFAAFENIKYVFGYGLSVSVPRAFLAIPGHMGFAVFMGTFYGTAKLCQSRGHRFGKFINLLTGYLAAVLLHGFYDSCAMIGSGMSTTLFVAFVVIMYIVVIAMIKKESASDRPV
jgi:RsiW-degrading membrane proteinase PrsW (M82 family)